MAFMLGSAASGMFDGMSSVLKFGQGLQNYKNGQDDRAAAEETRKQIEANKGGVKLPTIQNNTSSGGPMDRHDDNPAGKVKLTDVKQPLHLQFGPSAREHDNEAVPTTPAPKPPAGTDETTPNTAGGGAATNPGATPITSLGPKATAAPTNEFTGGGYNPSTGLWGGAPTGTPTARTAAPKYLPTPANPSGGQPQTGPAAVFGANQQPRQGVPTSQVASNPVAGGPGTASPQQSAYGPMPTLASGQSGLGAQLMASMNPTAGATA